MTNQYTVLNKMIKLANSRYRLDAPTISNLQRMGAEKVKNTLTENAQNIGHMFDANQIAFGRNSAMNTTLNANIGGKDIFVGGLNKFLGTNIPSQTTAAIGDQVQSDIVMRQKGLHKTMIDRYNKMYAPELYAADKANKAQVANERQFRLDQINNPERFNQYMNWYKSKIQEKTFGKPGGVRGAQSNTTTRKATPLATVNEQLLRAAKARSLGTLQSEAVLQADRAAQKALHDPESGYKATVSNILKQKVDAAGKNTPQADFADRFRYAIAQSKANGDNSFLGILKALFASLFGGFSSSIQGQANQAKQFENFINS